MGLVRALATLLVSGEPHPKPAKRSRARIRIIDPDAVKTARLVGGACAACRRAGTNAHHVINRGAPHFGDDVPENLLMLCGTGTTQCHGAVHGNPYVDRAGKRWTEKDVRRAIGAYIQLHRPDVIAYVLGKLGREQGIDYLARRYLIDAVLIS